MKIRNLNYYLREAFRSIIRNRLMSVASIITVASCILILAFSYCIVSNLDNMLSGFEEKMELAVYIDDEISDAEIESLKDEILRIDHVSDVVYVSAQEAIERFGQNMGEDNGLILGLEDVGILPRSFDIKVDSINYQLDVKEALESLKNRNKGITEVKFDKDTVDALIGLNNVLRIVSILIIVFLSIVAIVIIMNTIKLTVNSRKNEINIMKYVGATDSFIRWPFIIEGMLIGLLGAIFPVALCWFGYGKVVGVIEESIPVITNLVAFKSTYSVFIVLIPFSLILGMGIGVIGSVTSIKRHLFV